LFSLNASMAGGVWREKQLKKKKKATDPQNSIEGQNGKQRRQRRRKEGSRRCKDVIKYGLKKNEKSNILLKEK